MNYLFFDLEFASCKGGYHKVCEFGYVLVGDDFSLVERGNFFIDPSIPRNEWDFFALRKIMKKRISDFAGKPSFPDRYRNIKALFEKADIAFGHSTVGDVQALNQECARFSLPALSFVFLDLCEFYRRVTQTKDQRSLTSILAELSIEGDANAHDAEADAFNTMLCTRELLLRENQGSLSSDPAGALEKFLSKYGFSPRSSGSVPVQPHRKRRRSRRRTATA